MPVVIVDYMKPSQYFWTPKTACMPLEGAVLPYTNKNHMDYVQTTKGMKYCLKLVKRLRQNEIAIFRARQTFNMCTNYILIDCQCLLNCNNLPNLTTLHRTPFWNIY